MAKAKIICSVCKTEPHSDDAGYGIVFKAGDPILCKQKRGHYGKYHLHYHNEGQLRDAIIDTANGENNDDRAVRSMTAKDGVCLKVK